MLRNIFYRKITLMVNKVKNSQFTFCSAILPVAIQKFVSLIHCICDRYGASWRQVEDDIGSILPVPCTTELHHDSRHRISRERLVTITARYHTAVCAALRTLVVSLIEHTYSIQISRGRLVVSHSTNERNYLRNSVLFSHKDSLITG
jgi:hypothetical protein